MGFNVGNLYELHTRLIASQEPPPAPDPDPEPPPDVLPDAPCWMLWVMLFVCACVIGAVVYSIMRPAVVAMEVTQMEVISVTEAGNILMAAIGAILAGGLAAPVTTPVVNLIKGILKLVGWESKVSGNTISMAVAVVVTVAMWLSRHWGMELQANTVMDWLVVAIPPFVQVLSMFASQKGIFGLSQRLEAPGYGYTRSA